jgi:hypothetical protein
MAKPLEQKVEESSEPKDLSAAIEAISTSLQKLLKSGLNRRAIVVLLHDATKISKRDIESVLSGLDNLKRMYTYPK